MAYGDDRRHEVARTLGTVARELESEPDEERTLASIVLAAVDTVPGVTAGGITEVQRRQVTARAPTNELVAQCDQLQDELGEGPCLDAIWEEQTIIVNDLVRDGRWPRFGARAAELGAASLISFRLYVQQHNLGALNLYGASGAEFGQDERIIGEVFATHAALALSEARQYRQFNEALVSRDAIGQAKGLLMARHDLTGKQAFDMLVRASQHANIKLTDIAHWLVNEHEHPEEAHRPQSA